MRILQFWELMPENEERFFWHCQLYLPEATSQDCKRLTVRLKISKRWTRAKEWCVFSDRVPAWRNPLVWSFYGFVISFGK
jgi:hypothetical protein